jgi:opacity protein-like surface antigen
MLAAVSLVQAQIPKFSLGFRGGVARLDGDIGEPKLSPEVNGVFSFSLWPHLALGAEAGFTDLQLGASADTAVLRMVPLSLNLAWRFAPYGKVSPFVTVGGGGAFWQHIDKRTNKPIPLAGQTKKQFDYFLKTAGGLDIFLSPRITWTTGAAYRYALTDKLDFTAIGDQDDSVITAFTGFTVNIGKVVGDADHDGVIDRYDLDSKVREDRDGYLDHDGVPDSPAGGNIAAYVSAPNTDGVDKTPPIVIHSPVLQAPVGRDIHLRAEVFENQRLLKAALLYRPVNVRRWLVEPLNSVDGRLFVGTIPSMAVSKDGVEYCIVAVDEAISGVGYSGLPNRPNFVRVHGKETWWRIVTGLVAAGSWSAAGYLVYREQK